MQVPYEYLQSNSPALDWCDLLWGYKRRFISWSDVVNYAADFVADQYSENAQELAGIGKESVFRVGELLEDLASQQGNCEEEKSRQVWLKHVLGWLFRNKASFADPLAEVESIYADFDYPVEIEPFVRYMPTDDGYDPSRHSPEENVERMLSKWAAYVQS